MTQFAQVGIRRFYGFRRLRCSGRGVSGRKISSIAHAVSSSRRASTVRRLRCQALCWTARCTTNGVDRFEDKTDALVRHIADLLRENKDLRAQIERAQEQERGSHFPDSPDRRRRERRNGIDRRSQPDPVAVVSRARRQGP